MPNGPRMSRPVQGTTYGTPDDFLSAVHKRWGRLEIDLAAEHGQQVPGCSFYITPEMDSLKQDWTQLQGHLWLNPPYDNIKPWAEKCAQSCRQENARNSGRVINFLVPASVGSRWWYEHVWPYANTYALIGRLTFKGETTPYPKDCILARYHYDGGQRFEPWDWRKDVVE